MEATTVAMGHYVYAFVRSQDAENVLALLATGLNEAKLVVHSHDGLSIVTSSFPIGKIRPKRQLLAAHQSVVSIIASQFDTLPVSFGLIADDSDSLDRMLQSNTEVLLEQLDKVAGKVEMGLCLSWTIGNIYQYFCDRDPELEAARTELASGNASHDLKLSVGRRFEALLNAECDRHLQTVVDGLSPLGAEIEVQSKRNEQDVLRVSCLIQRDQEPEFAAALNRIAANYDDNFAFSFNGPWPAYSFVNITVTTE